MTGFRYIGKKRRTKEDPRFVTGRGRFVADVARPGMKHVALVTSPHASARIKSIRCEKARAMEGVHYVLTGEEFSRITFAELHQRICDALRGNRSPIVAEVLLPDGSHQIIRDRKKQ